MAWNGTVTCSECWKEGHNRNGCPRRKERYEAALAMPEEERGYSESRVIRDFEEKKERATTRKCSYCDEQKHNRRSCQKLKEHFAVIAEMNRDYRTKFVEWIQENRLNIGSLIRNTESTLCLVSGLRWDQISVWQGEIPRFILAKPVTALGEQYQYQYTISDNPEWPTGERWTHKESYSLRSYGAEVVSPVDILAKPPKGWTEDTQPVKAFFKDRTLYQWTEDPSHYNSHDWWKLDGEEEKQDFEECA